VLEKTLLNKPGINHIMEEEGSGNFNAFSVAKSVNYSILNIHTRLSNVDASCMNSTQFIHIRHQPLNKRYIDVMLRRYSRTSVGNRITDINRHRIILYLHTTGKARHSIMYLTPYLSI
jgi:hypothetical protein